MYIDLDDILYGDIVMEEIVGTWRWGNTIRTIIKHTDGNLYKLVYDTTPDDGMVSSSLTTNDSGEVHVTRVKHIQKTIVVDEYVDCVEEC